ncbi:anti-sigma factor [Lysobacter solisilvae (ex Woo and Kim 2022)]|uniref:Anti-sigma factor n=1 Tax=Agrilutibacter terrestris TaxID=2865112 RepID=A0A7H0G0D8_9GAMM|nr:anti-sigma factor [Lysobacter terrestris]QNP41754.1 anti-sigma factor [Lysobacter terrestris]
MNLPNERFDEESPRPPGDEVEAGEYVLGVLDARERGQAQARITSDPHFAHWVDRWEAHFAPWLLRVDAVAPSLSVWPRIRARLGWSSERAMPVRAWDRVGFWRAAAGLAVAAGIGATVFGLRTRLPAPSLPPPVAVQPPGEEQAARPVTVLARGDGSTGWIATLDAARGKVLMVPVPVPADATGRVNELWIIPAGGAPISLGFVSNEKAHTIQIPAAARAAVAVGATFAVTLEPEAGIPHAAPTGPVVAQGGIRQI